MFEIDFREILTVGMVLFAVIDIVGSIPIIVDLRTKHGHIESEKASLVAGVIMIVFLFIGEEFLKVIGIDVHSFAVAGSFVLFFIALEMILGIRIYRDEESSSASIVPIAFPLIAGAGTQFDFSIYCFETILQTRKIIREKWIRGNQKGFWSGTFSNSC
ncbi:MAG: hypothetical protein RLZZ479_1456 [Bacteroidota bacterium]